MTGSILCDVSSIIILPINKTAHGLQKTIKKRKEGEKKGEMEKGRKRQKGQKRKNTKKKKR
jgi:hypothetical protein